MWRLIVWFLIAAALAWGLTWLADHPGTITIEWLGWRIEELPVSLALAVLVVAAFAVWLVFRLLRMLIGAPFILGDFIRLRRRKKAAESMTTGLVALLSGDVENARRAAQRAARLAPSDPLARLLQAQSALTAGDVRHADYLFRQLAEDETTEPAALRGLYDLAVKSGDAKAALIIAERAHARHPHLQWAAEALLRAAALAGDWDKVLTILERMKRAGLIDKQTFARKQAAALTAKAEKLEDSEPDQALKLALRAHKLDPSLVPAALIAARLLSRQGKMRKAAKVLQTTWKQRPHPDIAEVYAHLRPGDSPQDRLERVRQLLRVAQGGEDGAVALARAAIDAKDWDTALGALKVWLNENPSARIFLLMAELEEARSGDIGRMREWLHRARQARRDPAWVAGQVVSPVWLPATPDGEVGVFEWKEPPHIDKAAAALEPVPQELMELPAPAAALAAQEEAAAAAADAAEQAQEAGVVKIAEAGRAEETAAEAAPAAEGEASPAGESESRQERQERQDRQEQPRTPPPPRGAEAVAEVSEPEPAGGPPLPDDPGVPGAGGKA